MFENNGMRMVLWRAGDERPALACSTRHSAQGDDESKRVVDKGTETKKENRNTRCELKLNALLAVSSMTMGLQKWSRTRTLWLVGALPAHIRSSQPTLPTLPTLGALGKAGPVMTPRHVTVSDTVGDLHRQAGGGEGGGRPAI